MTTQTLSTPQAQRIGQINARVLKHMMPQEIIGRIGIAAKDTIPKRSGDTAVFRRWLPKGATSTTPNTWSVNPENYRLSEGETPEGNTITAQDISVTVREFGVVYRWTNRVETLYEDDVPRAIRERVGSEMGLVIELERWGKLKAGTNVYRAGSVASRASITGLISGNLLRNIARGLYSNLAAKVTKIITAAPLIGTQPIEAAWIVVCHTDMTADLRSQLTGFVHVSDYPQGRAIHPNEIGSWEEFRFIGSPHTAPYLSAGSTTTANTRLAAGVPNSAGTEAVDVYPIVIMSEECFGDVLVRGTEALKVNAFPASQATKDDPAGQRGVMAASTYFAAVRLNELQMAVYEVACSALVS